MSTETSVDAAIAPTLSSQQQIHDVSSNNIRGDDTVIPSPSHQQQSSTSELISNTIDTGTPQRSAGRNFNNTPGGRGSGRNYYSRGGDGRGSGRNQTYVPNSVGMGRSGGRDPMGRTQGDGRILTSGRIPMGGRGLMYTPSSNNNNNTGGRGTNNMNSIESPQLQQRIPIPIHSNSGVPYGHVPAYLPGSSSLVEELDQRILLVLRDGKHIIGTLISFDQFGNLVLINAVDRQIVSIQNEESGGMKRNYYSDIPLEGIYIARGESLVLVGEVHDNDASTLLMQPVSIEELGKLSATALPTLEWDFDSDLTA